MNEPVASGDNLLVLRDQLVDMRAELLRGLARGDLDARRLPVVARIEAAIDALDRSPRRLVVIAPPGVPIRLAFCSNKDSIEATQIAIECDKAGRIVVTVDHWTDEPEGNEAAREPLEAELGGNATASFILEPVRRFPQKRQPGCRLSPTHAHALALLAAAIEKAGEIPPANDYIPVKTRRVTENLWRSYCYGGQITKSDKPDAKRMAFNRAAERLVAVGRVGKWEPWVWILKP